MDDLDAPIFSLPRRWFLRSGAFSAACLAAPWSLEALMAGGAEANSTVWELSLSNGRANNCSLSAARVVAGDGGKLCVAADSRNDNATWHSCISVAAGLLKAGQDYVITVEYEIVDRVTEDAYFYVFARSNKLGQGADHWKTWSGEVGGHGTATLRVSLTADDYGVTAGIHKQGAMRVTNMKIVHGSGWTEQSLDGSVGGSAQAPVPTGAQPFTIDAPGNPNGPVVHLSDFGAVADGAAPPAAGPDRNLAALKAALEQCRKVKASKLTVAKGVYRIASGETMMFDSLSDFTFDGGGSTFLFHLIKGGAGVSIKNCQRTVFTNFNLDWDCAIDPTAWVGRVTQLAPDATSFEMKFETSPPLDPKSWVSLNPLDEKLRAPGAGTEFGGFTPKKIEKIDAQTVRVWPSYPLKLIVGHLYLLRHYTYEKHAVSMGGNSHLSLRKVNIFTFPGIGFITGGDQHHFELIDCHIAPPANESRPITTSADGFHVGQSQGFIRLEGCEFSFMGDDCINIHDNIHMGVRRVDDYTLVATQIVSWRCPFATGDPVEIRNPDFSPTGFTAKLKSATSDDKANENTLVFTEKLPARVPSDSILFNHRYGSHNVILRNCYFHENRARGVLCNSADWLIENNRFFHNQHAGMLLNIDVTPGLWSEGFGARNVIVRGNSFDTCNPKDAADGAAISMGATVRGSNTSYPLLEGILFEKNEFVETPGPALTAAAFRNLVVRNNTIVNREKVVPSEKMRGAIRAELGTGLWVEGNEWTTGNGIDAPGLFYDASTTRAVVCSGNKTKS